MTTRIHTQNWASTLTADLQTSTRAVIMTALSMLPPRTLKNDDFTRLWLSLADAARRGVAVQIALPQPALAHPATLRNDHAARDLIAIGVQVVLVPAANLLHAKTCCVDSLIAWVGSGNLTAAAAHHNRECWMRTQDARAVAELAGFHAQCFKVQA